MKATVTDVSKRITTKPNKQAGILNYDVDNAYPQRVVDILNSSGTGTLCTNIMGKFINGEGFVSELLAKTIVNSKKLTSNKLLKKVSKSISRHNGFPIHVNYNALFEKKSFDLIPFEHVRLTIEEDKDHPSMLAVYDDWQKNKKSKIEEKEIDYINFYNPDPVVIQEEVDKVGGWENYKGQILYWTTEGSEYVLAPSDSVLEDVQTDSHAKIFKNRNITTNFLASHIIETSEFESEELKEAFIESLVEFQGSDDALKLLLLEKKAGDGETGFKLEKIDIQDVEKLYEFTEGSVRDNIIRNYLIPPVLLLAVPGKLGSSSEIREATAFYNGVTNEDRQSVSEVFEELFKNSVFTVGDDFEIQELQPKIVEAKETNEGKKEVIALLSNVALSETQKKTILEVVYGYSSEESMRLIPTLISAEGGEEAVDEEAKARASLKGSVGGVNGILSVQAAVSSGVTEPDAGAAILELIFGLTPEQAKRMLAKKDIIVQ